MHALRQNGCTHFQLPLALTTRLALGTGVRVEGAAEAVAAEFDYSSISI